MAFHANSEELPLRLEIVVSSIDVSPVVEQISHLVGSAAGKACELSLRLTLMEYPVLSIVPPAVDIEASPVVDFGGRGKSCDFTVKAEAAGFEPVPLWLLLVLRVGPDEPYLLATACFDMRRYVQKAAAQMSDHPPVPFDRIKLALAPTTDLPGSVEVSVFLRMSKVCGTAPLRRDKASEAVEPPRQQQQQPTVVCATANVGTEPWPGGEEEHGHPYTGGHSQRRSDGLMINTEHGRDGDRGRSMSRSRGGRAHSTGLSPGRLRQRLSHSVEEQLRRSRERRRTLSRSLSRRRRSRSPPMSALGQLNRRGRERFGSVMRRSTSEHALRLSAPYQGDGSPRLPSTAPSLHDVLAADDQDARRRRASLGAAVASPSSRKPSTAPSHRRVPLAKTLSLIQELSSEITKIQRMTASKASRGAAFGGETVTCYCCGAEVPISRADIHAKRRCLRVLPSALSSVHDVAGASRRVSRQVWR